MAVSMRCNAFRKKLSNKICYAAATLESSDSTIQSASRRSHLCLRTSTEGIYVGKDFLPVLDEKLFHQFSHSFVSSEYTNCKNAKGDLRVQVVSYKTSYVQEESLQRPNSDAEKSSLELLCVQGTLRAAPEWRRLKGAHC
jgi:hypothetical protein